METPSGTVTIYEAQPPQFQAVPGELELTSFLRNEVCYFWHVFTTTGLYLAGESAKRFARALALRGLKQYETHPAYFFMERMSPPVILP